MTKEDAIYPCQQCSKCFRSSDEGVYIAVIENNTETKVGFRCPQCHSTNIKLRGTVDRIIINSSSHAKQ